MNFINLNTVTLTALLSMLVVFFLSQTPENTRRFILFECLSHQAEIIS